MIEDNIVELGVDVNTNWEFVNGDLLLVDNETNIMQSIINRLNCEYDALDNYYFEYGSDIKQFLGFKSSNETLEFIKIEVENTLEQDPRLNDFTVETRYDEEDNVLLNLNIKFSDDSDLSMSLVIDEVEGVVLLDNVSSNDIEDEE